VSAAELQSEDGVACQGLRQQTAADLLQTLYEQRDQEDKLGAGLLSALLESVESVVLYNHFRVDVEALDVRASSQVAAESCDWLASCKTVLQPCQATLKLSVSRVEVSRSLVMLPLLWLH
jgi:hypothetical protein